MDHWYSVALEHLAGLKAHVEQLESLIESDTLTPEIMNTNVRSQQERLSDAITCIHRQWD